MVLVNSNKPIVMINTPLAILMKHVNDPLPLPRVVDPSIPEPFERVALKALAKQPADRFQSTAEMAAALVDTRALKQPVVIDNRAGAAGNIGVEMAARANPDGYTLLMGISTLAINPAMYKKVTYDAIKDFAPISLVASVPFILVVHPTLPVKSVRELIALAKAAPGKLNYASAAAGTATTKRSGVGRSG